MNSKKRTNREPGRGPRSRRGVRTHTPRGWYGPLKTGRVAAPASLGQLSPGKCPAGAAAIFTAARHQLGGHGRARGCGSSPHDGRGLECGPRLGAGSVADHPGGDLPPPSASEPTPMDKVNEVNIPAGGEVGAAHRKVSMDPLTPKNSRVTPPFTCRWAPTHSLTFVAIYSR